MTRRKLEARAMNLKRAYAKERTKTKTLQSKERRLFERINFLTSENLKLKRDKVENAKLKRKIEILENSLEYATKVNLKYYELVAKIEKGELVNA